MSTTADFVACRSQLDAVAIDAAVTCGRLARAGRSLSPEFWRPGSDLLARQLYELRSLRSRLDRVDVVQTLDACARLLGRALRLLELAADEFEAAVDVFHAEGFAVAEPRLRRGTRLFAEAMGMLADQYGRELQRAVGSRA